MDGNPFTIPYGCLIPAQIDGLLVCEKNISVTHIANGATRLQPVVMGIGQAAGMAAALCVTLGFNPQDLPVRSLQEALLQDQRARAAIVPLFNLPPNHPDWLHWQRYYLDHPDAYPDSGNCPCDIDTTPYFSLPTPRFSGIFHRRDEQDYTLTLTDPADLRTTTWTLVTLRSQVDEQLQMCIDQQPLTVCGELNHAGKWLLVEQIDS